MTTRTKSTKKKTKKSSLEVRRAWVQNLLGATPAATPKLKTAAESCGCDRGSAERGGAEVVYGADNLPKGWDQGSAKKYWDALTGEVVHKRSRCMKEMSGKVSDPGAFCTWAEQAGGKEASAKQSPQTTTATAQKNRSKQLTTTKHAALEFPKSWHAQKSPVFSCGFAISTSDEHLIEENYRSKLEEEGKEFSGFTDAEVEQLNADSERFETNALAWINENIGQATDQGHGGHEGMELIGNVWVELDGSAKSRERVELLLHGFFDSLYEWDLPMYEGVGDNLLGQCQDVTVQFFGIEEAEAEMLEHYAETGELPPDPSVEPVEASAPRLAGDPISSKMIGGKKFYFQGGKPYVHPEKYLDPKNMGHKEMAGPKELEKKKKLQQQMQEEITKLQQKEPPAQGGGASKDPGKTAPTGQQRGATKTSTRGAIYEPLRGQRDFTAQDLLKAFGQDMGAELAQELAEQAQAPSSARGRSELMEDFNKAIGGHGVEAIRDENVWNDYYGDTIALYVNTGDTYNATIVFDIGEVEFYLTSYGDWLEAVEYEASKAPPLHSAARTTNAPTGASQRRSTAMRTTTADAGISVLRTTVSLNTEWRGRPVIISKLTLKEYEPDWGELLAHTTDASPHSIYDDGADWLRSFRAVLRDVGYSTRAVKEVQFSEYGMQGRNDISMDVGSIFIAEYKDLNPGPTTKRRSTAMRTTTANVPTLRVASTVLSRINREGAFDFQGWRYERMGDAEKEQSRTPDRPSAEDAPAFVEDTYDSRAGEKPPKMDDLDFPKGKKPSDKPPGAEAAPGFVEDTPAEWSKEKPKPVRARHLRQRGLSARR